MTVTASLRRAAGRITRGSAPSGSGNKATHPVQAGRRTSRMLRSAQGAAGEAAAFSEVAAVSEAVAVHGSHGGSAPLPASRTPGQRGSDHHPNPLEACRRAPRADQPAPVPADWLLLTDIDRSLAALGPALTKTSRWQGNAS